MTFKGIKYTEELPEPDFCSMLWPNVTRKWKNINGLDSREKAGQSQITRCLGLKQLSMMMAERGV